MTMSSEMLNFQSTAPQARSVNSHLKRKMYEGVQETAEGIKNLEYGIGQQMLSGAGRLLSGDKGQGYHGDVNDKNDKLSAAPTGEQAGKNVSVTIKEDGTIENEKVRGNKEE